MLNTICHAKLYHVECEKNGVLIHDFVPAQKRGDGTIGLFDILNNKFIGNAGTGEFIDGPEVQTESTELPAEYHQVEYIESHGTGGAGSNGQQIDTGLTFDMEHDSLELTFQSTNQDQDSMVIASHDAGNFFWLYQYSNMKQIVNYIRNDEVMESIGSIPRDMSKHTYVWKHKTSYMDGVAIGQVTKDLGETDGHLFIASYQDKYHFSGKFFACSIYKGSTLARDFVPCYRIADNVVGMYDLVTNQFFTNSGSGAFTCGADIDDSRDYAPFEKAELPEYYYQLNYLESTGLQSLDTGVVGGAKIDATIKFTRNSATQIMGYSDTGGHFFGVGSNNKYVGTAIDAGGIDHIVVDVSNAEEGKGAITINEIDPTVFSAPDLADKTLKLFSVGTAANKCTALLYSAKIYQGDELVRDFVPVMQKQTRTAGLYDLVEQRFYESTTDFGFESGGILFADIDVNNINVFCNLNNDKSHPYSTKINSFVIYGNNTIVRNFVSVIRNNDGVAGLIDLVTNEFYTSNSEFELSYGKIIGHKIDEGRVVKKPTYNERGEIVYKTLYTNEEIHVKTDCTAYKVSFITNNGNLTGVKIFNNNDPNNYVLSLVGYTRNQYTYNYSKSGAYIHFEIPDDGLEYKVTTTSGKITQDEENKREYIINNITGDAFVQLRVQ